MPIQPQPRGARGTVGHPYSALNLRLVLAVIGVLSCAVLAGVLFWLRYRPVAVVAALLAVAGLVDVVVIERRRRARRRVEGGHTSLFE
jgi:uncharacterized membrane protein YqjE